MSTPNAKLRRTQCAVDDRVGGVSPTVGWLIRFAVSLAVTWMPLAAMGQQLGGHDLRFDLIGARLVVDPPALTVPKDIPTFVRPEIVLPEEAGPEAAQAIAELTAGAAVIAELRGPEIEPTVISALPGEPLNLPPFAVTGDYFLDNIRLERDGVPILAGDPPAVRIKVIDDILVTQVVTQELTLDEIRERGLVIDESSFRVLEFSAVFVIDGSQVPISFPSVLPRRPNITPTSTPQTEIAFAVGTTQQQLGTIVDLPPQLDLPGLNLYLVGAEFVPVELSENDQRFTIPPIPALIAIPGNIGFLNDFFKAIVMVQNGAPIGTNLSVRDIEARIVLPAGLDQVAGTPDAPGDDPLRLARTADGVRDSVPVRQPGPDEVTGTADDTPYIGPGETAQGEFLIEGLREGTHVFDVALSGVLEGLPAPVFLESEAKGLVQVKNATFSLTLSHPDTVAVGESYSLYATITNTSDQIANLLSISLDPFALSGARFADGAPTRVTFDTLASGDSVTAELRLVAERTGAVTFSQIASDPGVTTSFALRGGVDERDVPLSPSSLVLPSQVNRLPHELIMASQRVLAQAYSVATAPRLPAGVRYVPKRTVVQRGLELAFAGIETDFGLPLERGLYNLTLDWLGNAVGDPGFEQLLRDTGAGADWTDALGAAIAAETTGRGVLGVQEAFAEATVSREPHLSAAVGNGGAPAPVRVSIANNLGQRLAEHGGGPGDDGPGVGNLPFTQLVTLERQDDARRQLAVVGRVNQPTYTIELEGTGTGSTDLGIVVPGTDGELVQLAWTSVPLEPGSRARVVVHVGSPNTVELQVDADGNGSFEDTRAPSATLSILDGPPAALAARSVTNVSEAFGANLHAAHFGLLVDVLFDQAVDPESAEDPERYTIPFNGVHAARVQATGRVVTLYLKSPLGALPPRAEIPGSDVPRDLTVAEVADLRGQVSSPTTLPVADRLADGARLFGQVQRATGEPVPGAIVQVFAFGPTSSRFGCTCPLAELVADEQGFYSVDFVRRTLSPYFEVRAIDTVTQEDVTVLSRVRADNELIAVNPVFFGRGRVVGRVLLPDGVTPAGPAAVVVTPDWFRTGEVARGVYADAAGRFAIEDVPVGLFSLTAQVGTWVTLPNGVRQLEATGEIATVTGAIRAAGETVELDVVTTVPPAPGSGTVRGRVFLSDRVTPAANYPVFFGSLSTDREHIHAIAQTFTDENGAYRFDGLPVGGRSVIAVDPVTQAVTDASATVGAGTITITNLVFGATGSVRVIVRNASGQLVPDALVAGGYRLVTTDANGEALIPEVPIGRRRIAAGSQDPVRIGTNEVDVFPGQTSTVEVRLEPAADITGRVTDATGAPVPGALVRIPIAGLGYYKAESDEFGLFRFRNMALGDYTVSASGRAGQGIPLSDDEIAERLLDDAADAARSREMAAIRAAYRQALEVLHGVSDLQAPAAPATPGSFGYTRIASFLDGVDAVANIEYLPTGSVGGVTIDANGLPTKAAMEVSGLTLDAFGFPAVRPLARFDSGTVDGRFSAPFVTYGDYRVQAANPFSGAIVTAAGTLGPTNPSDDDLVLQFPGGNTGELTGIVLLPDGVTPAGENVPVLTSFGDLTPRTRADGTFDAQVPIPAGVYTLTAEDPTTTLAGQTVVRIDAGRVTYAPVRLLGRGSARVLVQRPDGAEVPNAEVEISAVTFPRESRAGVTGADGTVLFENLPEGHYSILAREGDQLTGRGGFSIAQSDVLAGDVVGSSVTLRGYGTVRGVFLTAGTLEPIPNAQISLSVQGISTVRGLGDVGALTVTDANGRFEYTEVPVGNFTATGVDPTNLRPGATSGTLFGQGDVVDITIVTRSLGRVEGIVVAGNGLDPIPGATVWIVPAQQPTGTRQFPYITAGADGRFTFDGVPEGRFSVTAHDPQSGFNGTAIGEIAGEGDVELVEVRIAAHGTITGTVYAADGTTPVSNARVTRLVQGGKTAAFEGTDENGRYTLDRVPLGEYEIQAVELSTSNEPTQNGASVLVELTEPDQALETDIVLNGTGRVEITVVDANDAPVQTADVLLQPHGEFGRELTGFTAADGTIAFDGVAVGPFDVRAESSVLRVGGAVNGEIPADGETVAVTVELGEAGSVLGRLVLPDVASTPVPGARATLRFESQTQFTGVLQTFTDELGAFRFDDIPLGSFRLELAEPISSGVAIIEGALTFHEQALDLGLVPLDLDAPRVVASSPAQGETGVAEDASIVLTFSEPIDPTSVLFDNQPTNPNIAGNVYLVDGAGAKQRANVTVSPDGLTLTVDPENDFASEGRYQLAVAHGGGAIRDAAAERTVAAPFVLAFSARDSVPPQLLSASPPDGAVGVEADAVLRFTFDESIAAGASIALTRGGAPVAGTVTPLISDTVLVFTPAQPLALNATYEYTVDDVLDAAGNALAAAPITGTFRTLDTQGPVITALVAPPGPRIGGTTFVVEALTQDADVAKIELSVNGVPAATVGAPPYVFTAPAPLAATEVSIAAVATDLSGNRGPVATLVLPVLPNTPPTVSLVNAGGAASAARGDVLELEVAASDDLGLTRVVVSAAGAFAANVDVPLAPGQTSLATVVEIPVPANAPSSGNVSLQAAAFDGTGFAGSSSIITLPMRDGVPPVVVFTSPVNGAQVPAGAAVRVTVAANDDVGLASVTLACTPSLAGCGTRAAAGASAAVSFDLEVPDTFAAPQVVHLTASARDGSDNVSLLAARTLQVADVTAPSEAVLSTGNGLTRVLQGETVTLRAQATDNVGVAAVRFAVTGAVTTAQTVTVPGAPTTAAAQLPIVVPLGVPDGASVDVAAVAIDAAGNEGAPGTLALTVGDAVAPTATIVAPADGATFAPGTTLTLEVEAEDDLGVREIAYVVAGVFGAGDVITIAPPQTHVTRSIPIPLPADVPPGALMIEVFATDGRNTSAVVVRTVEVADAAAPAVTILSPASGATIDPRNPLAVTVRATDNVGVVEIGVTSQGALAQTETVTIAPPEADAVRTLELDFASLPAAGGTLTVTAQARDAAQNLGGSESIVLTVLDVAAPAVTAVTPVDGATGVVPTSDVVLAFSEPLDPATVDDTSVTLAHDGTPLPAAVALTAPQTVTVTPLAPLPAFATVTVSVAETVTDLEGNPLDAPFTSSFTVGSDDTEGPRVSNTTPADGATGVSIAPRITVRFDEPVDPASITEETVRLLVAGAPVTAAQTLLSGDTQLALVPAEPLPFATDVTIELTGGITDAAGNGLRDASGQPAQTPLAFTFTTGDFGITSPVDGARILEGRRLTLQAAAAPALGVADVVFTVNGVALPPAAAPDYLASYDVPSSELVATLTISADARDASGVVLATDEVTVDVVPGLTVSPRLIGVPLTETVTLDLTFSSAPDEDLAVTITPLDPAIVGIAPNPLVLPAGVETASVALTGLGIGSTTVLFETELFTAGAVVSVGVPVTGVERVVPAAPVGAIVRDLAVRTALVMPAAGGAQQVSVQLLDAPAAEATPVTVTSSDPAVATVVGPITIAPGSQSAVFTITTGATGVAELRLSANGRVTIVRVYVGVTPPEGLPAVLAPPVGMIVRDLAVRTSLILPTLNDVHEVSVRLLDEPAADATPVFVTSSDPDVAMVLGPVTIAAGSEGAVIPIMTGEAGVAELRFSVNGRVTVVRVHVAVTPPEGLPAVLAPPVGTIVRDLAVRTTLLVPTPGDTLPVSVRVLDAPAAQPTEVTVTSSDPAVATALGPILVAPGGTSVDLTVITGEAGVAELRLTADGRVTVVRVHVGTTPPDGVPAILAPAIGVEVQ